MSNFFSHKDLFAVFVRTQVIHNLFESNKNLDPNKLDLFHVQYTSSLIDLFQKLKKAKEQQYLLLSDEIYINQDLVRKLEGETVSVNFTDISRKHAKAMAAKIKQLYEMLAGGALSAFSWGDTMAFSQLMRAEFFRPLESEQFAQLTKTEGRNCYKNEFVTIERKLLGRLNIHNFRIKFSCAFVCDDEVAEVFDFVDSNDKFVFINSSKSFYFLDEKMSQGIDLSKNESNKTSIIIDLKIKSDALRERQATIKSSIAPDVEDVLSGYLEKISGVDFLDELQNVDEQTNILRAMLNININSK
ncbi:hypothetical protein R1T16_02235 [Flavobacterium sp. DG1-102-2]|uniref:hypothetical protein n=1 Tax=Flavobacterium sp. DG1-102-2 TaxID=3081663 RepID=UPI002949EF42|nr:hypothetical protein [Flavobacterium sp. DG1-102-2]MDV6167225.1 hypothetical protein [Flavobacterium sp. DG1-102-2]